MVLYCLCSGGCYVSCNALLLFPIRTSKARDYQLFQTPLSIGSNILLPDRIFFLQLVLIYSYMSSLKSLILFTRLRITGNTSLNLSPSVYQISSRKFRHGCYRSNSRWGSSCTFSFGIGQLVSLIGTKALNWPLCAIATIVTCGRFCLRARNHGFRLDDAFSLLALISLIAYFTVLQFFWQSFDLTVYLKTEVAHTMLLWTTLYLVKASFLNLCWSNLNASAEFRRAWWLLTIWIFLSFWPLFLSELWHCGSPSNYADPQSCLPWSTEINGQPAYWIFSSMYGVFVQPKSVCNPSNYMSSECQTVIVQSTGRAAAQPFRFDTTMMAFGFHITSDLLILGLPLWFSRRFHMSKTQKHGITTVFAIASLDVIIGIIRNASLMFFVTNSASGQSSYFVANWLGAVEPALAVIACALPGYWVLVSPSQNQREVDMQPKDSLKTRTESLSSVSIDGLEVQSNLSKELEANPSA